MTGSNPSQLVSVITPAWNAGAFIEQTIHTALNQSYPQLEVIVVDDGSTDDTAAKVQALAGLDPRVRYARQPNRRQACARNHAISLSHGRCLAFLDADDLWSERKIETQLQHLDEHQADVVFSAAAHRSEASAVVSPVNLFGRFVGRFDAEEMRKLLLTGNAIPISSVLVKREFIERAGAFDERSEINGCEDWDLWLSLARAGAVFYGSEEQLVTYRSHPDQTSQNTVAMARAAIAVTKKHRFHSLSPPEQDAESFALQRWLVRVAIDAGDLALARRELAALQKMPARVAARLLHTAKYWLRIEGLARFGLDPKRLGGKSGACRK